MANRSLAQAARYFGISRQDLIQRMRNAGLLDSENLPASPVRDRCYLQIKQGQWYHPVCGMQYSQSTRVTQAGLNWLASKLDLELPPVPEDRRGVT
ncbi:phage antirepressor KilAC domain-containing protein [Pseudomonas sp. MYb185]|uniref:phage antirepressor KilAC domain-containing protein n=1 Tax=Pseudomonas sp. MYb185 TaxID=1848729 RepID=UPI000CFD6BED|nr:phage antirepressor KilAC domain-containing protein [Pseudomonas sp. MYb185]PRB80504.1 DNA-binding protein [Pseudomonas sp. MYb185]